MTKEHLLLPGVTLSKVHLLDEHRAWLEKWLRQVEEDIERGEVSSSECLMGVMAEIVLCGQVCYDWCGVLQKYLTSDGEPIAYSESYGRRLYKFGEWKQTPIHCIHTRWWIERVCCQQSSFPFADKIRGFIQPNNWIYNPKVSETVLTRRMKSEYMMSMAMGLEILRSANYLEANREGFKAALSSEPLSEHLSAEYFRIAALEILDSTNLVPCELDGILCQCETDSGYCDFSVSSKVDDYMGTAKRVSRDKEVHSPLAALYARAISLVCSPETQCRVTKKLQGLGKHLRCNPLDIPAFKIRDIAIPFGTDLSPLEVIAASYLVQSLES